MKQRSYLIITATMMLALSACSTVNVTKTSNETFAPVRSNHVEILMTAPSRPYVEVASVSTQNWNPAQTARMHNALRSKAAPLGANAVLLQNNGIDNDGKIWATGVAIRFTEGEGRARVE